LLKRVEELLEDIQKSLLIKAREFLEKGIDHAKTLKELKEKLEMKKIVKVFMVDDQEIETQIKEETGGATSRIIVESEKEGICIKSGKKTKTVAYFAKGY
jgi:prolyl-tRNA synthetase